MLEPAPDLTSVVVEEFMRRHHDPPTWLARASGRVNVIGEHTDYLGGLCLPLALPYATWVAATPRTDDVLHLSSSAAEDWVGSARRHLGARAVRPQGWAAHAVGALRAVGHGSGIDLHVESTVPLGAGLSSSAALICAVTTAVTTESAVDLVAPSTWAEQVAVGAPTGGMDQCAALLGVEDHVLLLDFSGPSGVVSEATPWRPRQAGLELLIVDTGTRHDNSDGAFAARRREGEAALGPLPARDASPVSTRRRRHVDSENARVGQVVAAAEAGDWRAVGEQLTASHRSLRDDYEVSAPALDIAVEAALTGGALGARMTGAGFGGCVVVLAEIAARTAICGMLRRAATESGQPEPRFLSADASGPATRLGVTGP